jgi:Predicted membrane protein (DUF2207) C-terminal domain
MLSSLIYAKVVTLLAPLPAFGHDLESAIVPSNLSGLLQPLLLPAVLCIYYICALVRVGRGPKPGPVIPQYEPPANLSPAAMRYLLTGTTDRKTVAAVLAHLAAHKIVTIVPEGRDYRVTRTSEPVPKDLPAEEVVALQAIAELEDFAQAAKSSASRPQPQRGFLLRPSKYVSLLGSVITGSVNGKVEQLAFRRNLGYAAPAIAFSFIMALGLSASYERPEDTVFLTLWLLFCSFIMGLIVAMSVAPALRDALRGRLGGKNVATAMIPLLMFSMVMGFVDWKIAKATSPAFAWMLLLVVAVNIGFAISFKRMTPEGRKLLDAILGFREFLSSVELDQLNRMNDPRLTPALLNDYLAYAIALDLKEDWGDHLSNALVGAATSAG